MGSFRKAVAAIVVFASVSGIDSALAQSPIFRRGLVASVCRDANAIVVYDQLGNVVNALQSPTFNAPDGIAFTAEAELLVVSTGNQAIYRLSPAGDFTATYSAPECPNPRSVAIGPNGKIYVTTGPDGSNPAAVVQFSSSGVYEDRFGTSILNSPRGLAFAPNGHCFVCDSTAGVVREFDTSWNNVGTWTDASVSFWPYAIAFTPGGGFWVSSTLPTGIYYFDYSGPAVVTPFSSDVTTGIAMNYEGQVMVNRYNSGSISAVTPSGVSTTWAAPTGIQPYGGIAVVPYRFTGRLKGRLDSPTVSSQKLNESVRITLEPGSGRVFVGILDGPSTTDFYSLTGVQDIVAEGILGTPLYFENRRSLHASELYEISGRLSRASVAGEMKGTWGSGIFAPTSGKFSFQWSHHAAVLNATITTQTLLP